MTAHIKMGIDRTDTLAGEASGPFVAGADRGRSR
jgi:hypothetical protein